MNNKFLLYLKLMRLHKPIGIGLLLWPTLWALCIAGNGKPNPIIVSIFVLGIILMRSAGCIINDIADRNIDCYVSRTQDRPLANKKISVRTAFMLFAFLALAAFSLVLQLNTLTVLLSVIGLLLTCIYPLMKRFTHWPQFFLGIAFAWGIPMAFAAIQQTIPSQAWLLFLTTVCWIMAYDTEYAMADKTDDIRIGVKSTAVLWGRYDRFIIGLLQIIVLYLLWMIGFALSLKKIYFISIILASFLFIYQQYLIKDRHPLACLNAFTNNNWFGLIIFLGLLFSL